MKFLFVNGSRGEWGYIRPVINKCISRNIEYQICMTNMMLLNEYGNLAASLETQDYNINYKILMSLEGGSHYSMAKSLSIFMSSFVDCLMSYRPDWVILAGDRGEQLMAAVAASYTYTPVAHIQAGELSGNIDGTARHAIGKLSHMHLASNQDACDRLIRLGEESFRVKQVGAPQLDDINANYLTSLDDLQIKFSISPHSYLLVVYHANTEENNQAVNHIANLVDALDHFSCPKICILPNNDAGSLTIRSEIAKLNRKDYSIYSNLARSDYLGLLLYSSAIVGNSSSGILEAPSLATPAVNIGTRQSGRIQGENVINATNDTASIIESLEIATSKRFRDSLVNSINPYGDGNSSERIIDILLSTPIDSALLSKRLAY